MVVSFAPRRQTTVVVVSLSSFNNAFCCTQSRPLFCRRERAPQHKIERETQNGDLSSTKKRNVQKKGGKSNPNPKHIILKSISFFPLSSLSMIFFLIFFLSSSSPLSSPSFVTCGLSCWRHTKQKKEKKIIVDLLSLLRHLSKGRAFYTLWGE